MCLKDVKRTANAIQMNVAKMDNVLRNPLSVAMVHANLARTILVAPVIVPSRNPPSVGTSLALTGAREIRSVNLHVPLPIVIVGLFVVIVVELLGGIVIEQVIVPGLPIAVVGYQVIGNVAIILVM
jgi:hypothetical protein